MYTPKIGILLFCGVLFANALTLHIAGTGDLQGMLQSFKVDRKSTSHMIGGIARIATIFNSLKQQDPQTLIVSSGDDLMGRYFQTFNGEAIYSLMSAAGYEFVIFGNHEFDRGTKVLHNALRYAKFHLICSDLSLPASIRSFTKSWMIKKIGKVKVGLFSLMSEDLPTITSAKNVALMGDNVHMAQKMVRLLRQRGADIIVALTHIGYKRDVALAKQVKGIDLIFGGHSHTYPKKMGHIGKTLIVNGGEKGKYVVLVSLPIDTYTKKVDTTLARMRYILVDENIKKSKKVEALLDTYTKKLPPMTILGKSTREWDLRVKTLRKSESGVADMINDLLRKKFRVDIVLNNSGAFRGKSVYPAGPITDAMLQEIDEFRNNAYILHIQGKWIKEILEHGAASYGKGGWLQVSGIRYQVDLRKPLQKVVDGRVVQEGERVGHIQVQKGDRWQDLNMSKIYKVLTNAFLARGGDGYFWFKKYGKNPKNTYTSFYSILLQTLQRYKELTPPLPDGRIQILR